MAHIPCISFVLPLSCRMRHCKYVDVCGADIVCLRWKPYLFKVLTMQVQEMTAVQALAVLLCSSSTVRCLSGASNGNASGIRNPEIVELPAGPGSGTHMLTIYMPVILIFTRLSSVQHSTFMSPA